jgi:hypothetical protein
MHDAFVCEIIGVCEKRGPSFWKGVCLHSETVVLRGNVAAIVQEDRDTSQKVNQMNTVLRFEPSKQTGLFRREWLVGCVHGCQT